MPSFTDIVKAIEFFNLCQTATFDVICQKANEEPSLVDARDTLGNSPLHIIVERFDTIFLPDVFKPNVNVVNNVGETPLHICVKLDKYHLAGILRNEFRGNLYLGNYADKNTRITLINSMSPKMKKVLKIKDLNIPPPSPLVRSTPVFSSITIIGRPQSRRLEKVEEEKKEETLKDRITKSNLPEEFKKAAIEKEDSISCNYGSSAAKDKEWVETLLKLPLNNYSSLPVSKKTSSMEDIKSFFKKVNDTLDEVSYGLDNVKEEIVDCISQMISTNNDCMPRILCLQGSQGCGKTSIVRGGISKILNRPFQHINMGGISDADYLIGHEQTYVGSRPGMIVQSLINSKVMNPIIFMDEVDKVSNTDKGVDIQSVLIHLTDPIQNTEFQDKYFAGLKLDVSKALFIFSCNDESKISPILRDRLNIIRIKEPTVNDKIIIGKKYLLKEISPNVGLKVEDILIDEECIKYILNTFCKDEIGLRGLKKCLETLLRKINTSLYAPSNKYSTLKDVSLPVKVSKKMIDEVLVKPENKFSEAMQSMFV
jgi:ATP-dependent Lon protease